MNIEQLKPDKVAIIGIPFDGYSSFLQGAAFAPNHIREAFHTSASNLSTENRTDLGSTPLLRDLGDIEFTPEADPLKIIEENVNSILKKGSRLLSLGGDHSITYPIIRAYASVYPNLNIIQLDAHPDLYEEFEGNRYSNASPFARIMEEKLVKRLVQIGIRTMNDHQLEQAKHFGVEVIEMQDWNPQRTLELEGPIYLSLDIDVLDPAYAPGVSHREAGGFSTRDVIGIIQQLAGPVVGADLVEYNPNLDQSGITAAAAAKLMKEILARLLD
jgi:agmatinase